MDTGGKIATGILVPLAVVGAVVGGYIAVKSMGGNNKHGKAKHTAMDEAKLFKSTLDFGGKRRTHRRRR